MAAADLFLACRIVEHPRAVEDVIKRGHRCLHPEQPWLNTASEIYLAQAQELAFCENVLL
ncbi:hypothetical protein B7P43_G11810 [Cryptotermes secundus]|uniref:Uncharacterized protein n=1 Tax=Cryptotermes secundus TaxID=105785 RepID=A0A2J7RBM7_9NEOP|nr:hypothetical protein B7P43_G11810 [Cryptotermes secundus]